MHPFWSKLHISRTPIAIWSTWLFRSPPSSRKWVRFVKVGSWQNWQSARLSNIIMTLGNTTKPNTTREHLLEMIFLSSSHLILNSRHFQLRTNTLILLLYLLVLLPLNHPSILNLATHHVINCAIMIHKPRMVLQLSFRIYFHLQWCLAITKNSIRTLLYLTIMP